MAQVTIYRTDQVSIGVTVAGVTLPNEPWDVLQGAGRTVKGVTALPGGQLPQRALGGIQERGPATLKKLWTATMLPVFKELEQTAGQAPITISYTVKATMTGPAIFSQTYTGVTGDVSRPDYDAKTSEPAYMTLMADLDGDAQ
jgi:hypothetical protein